MKTRLLLIEVLLPHLCRLSRILIFFPITALSSAIGSSAKNRTGFWQLTKEAVVARS